MPRTAVPVTTASQYARARDERRRGDLLYGRWGAELSDDWDVDRGATRRRAADRAGTQDTGRPVRTSRAADRDRAERGNPRQSAAPTSRPAPRSASAEQLAAARALAAPASAAGPEPVIPAPGAWEYVAEPPAERGAAGRPTVTIAGRGAEAYTARRGTRPSSAQRHQAIRRHEREGFRPDRVAMWAVALGVILMLAAVASAHAAVLVAHHVLGH